MCTTIEKRRWLKTFSRFESIVLYIPMGKIKIYLKEGIMMKKYYEFAGIFGNKN